MAKITEINQKKRLKKYGINIKTKYKTKDRICERNTDDSRNENVINGIRIEKRYYKNQNIIFKSKDFDSRILYTYVAAMDEKDTFECPNCGAVSLTSEADEGCPYCGTFLNMDYNHKNLGTKYSYDRTMRSSNYVKITLLVDLVVSLLISYLYIFVTGRTFNIYDIMKVLLGGITLCAALFYVFYYLDALLVLLPVKLYKDKMNQQQIAFWERMKKRGISKEKFYNNLNYEISCYYFEEQKDIIDYDIVDYNSLVDFFKEDMLYVRVNARIRLIRYQDNKVKAKTENRDYVLVYQGASAFHLKGGRNEIICKNCGASINITESICPYCNTKYASFQEWYLVKSDKVV